MCEAWLLKFQRATVQLQRVRTIVVCTRDIDTHTHTQRQTHSHTEPHTHTCSHRQKGYHCKVQEKEWHHPQRCPLCSWLPWQLQTQSAHNPCHHVLRGFALYDTPDAGPGHRLQMLSPWTLSSCLQQDVGVQAKCLFQEFRIRITLLANSIIEIPEVGVLLPEQQVTHSTWVCNSMHRCRETDAQASVSPNIAWTSEF